MSLRRITSLTGFLSFFIVLLTSIVLYIVPQGRVAYWVDWRLWTLSKEQWGAIHINVGFLFLASLILHIWYNWKPIVLYLKNKTKTLTVFTWDFNVALVLTMACIAGTYAEIPPFSTIIAISGSIKDSAAVKYGEPPYGHAELSSLKSFAAKMNLDPEQGMAGLKSAGYNVTGESQTILEIAKANGVTPSQVYLAMKPAVGSFADSPENSPSLPETPPPGTGNLTLADFCTRNNLDIQAVMAALKDSDVASSPDMTIKGIGETNQRNPTDIYTLIREGAKKP